MFWKPREGEGIRLHNKPSFHVHKGAKTLKASEKRRMLSSKLVFWVPNKWRSVIICILLIGETETLKDNPRHTVSNVVNGGEEVKTFVPLTLKSTVFQPHRAISQQRMSYVRYDFPRFSNKKTQAFEDWRRVRMIWELQVWKHQGDGTAGGEDEMWQRRLWEPGQTMSAAHGYLTQV